MLKKLAGLVLTVLLVFSTSVATAHACGSATLYEHGNYQGRTLDVSEDISCFVSEGFNDVLSSVKVHDGTLTLYKHCNYGQPSVTISEDGGEDGSGNYSSSAWLGGLNDEFSSIKVN